MEKLSLLRIFAVASLLVAQVEAQKVGLKSKLGFGCFNCALRWNFSCPAEFLPFNCRCANDDFLATALNCINVYAPGIEQVVWGYDYVRSQCHYWGNRTMSDRDLDRIYKKNIHRLVSPDGLSFSEAAPGPVAVPRQLFDKEYVAAGDTKYHYQLGTYFGLGIIGYWILVMVLATFANIIRIVNPGIYNIFGSRTILWIRKYVTLPALYGKKHSDPWSFLSWISIHAPTRGQALIILGFCALNIAAIVSFLDRGVDGALVFASVEDKVIHYVANRSGILAFMHIPILVLFACRNNPLIYLTSWPYDTFMTFHRWAARWMAFHAILHGVMLYWSSAKENVIMFKWRHVHNWRAGNLALYACFIMVVLALRCVRRRVYEVFKASHQLLFLMFLICLIVHCGDYGWLGWLWSTIVIYGVEYSMRISRIIASGGIQQAEIELTEAGMYRVRILGRRKWQMHPGAYVYIRILDSKLWWQSHPFSAFQSYSSRTGTHSFDLMCKVLRGSTAVINQRLLEAPGHKRCFRVTIEGPYGSSNYVYDYDSVLLLAGGVGFTAMYSFASTIVENIKPGQHLSIVWVVSRSKSIEAFREEVDHLMRLRHVADVHIYVTQPESSELSAISVTSRGSSLRDEEPGQVSRLNLQSEHAVDKSSATGELSSSSAATAVPSKEHSVRVCDIPEKQGDSLNTGPSTPSRESRATLQDAYPDSVLYGRPNLDVLVPDFIRVSKGTRAICSCGPPKFVDSTRSSLIRSIMNAESHIEYFEESFTW